MRKAIALVGLLAACEKEPIGPVETGQNGVTVALIATVEGCNVYRINPGGRSIYTTICPDRQTVAWEDTHVRSTGRTTYTTRTPHQVETVRTPGGSRGGE